MATSTLQRLATKAELDAVNNKNCIITIGNTKARMQLRTGSINVPYNTYTHVSFPAFPTTVLFCIPYCAHQGFGVPACISYSSLTNGGVDLYQINTVSASMTVGYIVIGY